ncbi:hypothetical protein CBR_g37331 [Chara braunii]|uniref:Integrase catalytic domain-containing protein n=1 Tax=Chara braunii TaxID=69332 RepID=A0A388JZP8_CHABU|nr:hypothetical protein CBR_g37331 [Chara braunii]|eukprot:GBG63246.1 hypothetical protein CBR_g37331 [Chara braunii]
MRPVQPVAGAACNNSLDDADQTHNQALAQLNSRFQQLEQRPVAAPNASSSNTFDRLNALEIDVGALKDDTQLQQTAMQQLEQRIYAAAANPSSAPRETTPRFDYEEIFCDSTKTDPISWFRKFEFKLQLRHISEDKHHAYLYSRSGGACQAWLENLLSKYGVVAADLYTKISWDDLKAVWHKRFQVELSEIKAMDKLMTFKQGTLSNVDWSAEYQRLTSAQGIQMGFKIVKHYFISRSCPELGNALTHVEDTLTTTAELFNKAVQIIVTNKEAKNLNRSFAAGPSRDHHRPKVEVVSAATPTGQSSEAVSANEGDRLAAARDAFIQRAGLSAQVRRKAHPTALKLADGRTRQLIDIYIEAVPVYFAPRACEPVTFDILDTDFDSGAEVSCTIPLPHPSIPCQVVTAKLFRATCANEQPDEKGLCFLRTVVVANSSPTDLSSDPRVVWLLYEFADIFKSPTGVVSDRPISHEIILKTGVVPPKGCIYRMSEEELTVLRAQLDDLLDKDWIRPSRSPYRASVLFIRKKNKDLRLCIDYHKLNAQTVKNAGPLPRIDDLLERLGGAKYFSKLDLKSGYHHISIRSNDRYNSTFKTRYGHFEWVVMPFGLTNAPATFQAAMTSEFRAMVTDNNPLVFYTTRDTVDNTIARWMAFIDQFNFFPDHISGKSDHFADALSRRPDHCTAAYSTFEIDDDLRDSFIRGYQADPDFCDKYVNCSSPNRRLLTTGSKRSTCASTHGGKTTFAYRVTLTCEHGFLPSSMMLTPPVSDRLTKFVMFLPCRYHAKAPELAEVLYVGWIRTKGYPKEIVCDRKHSVHVQFLVGAHQTMGLISQAKFGSHPQTNGQTERAHQTAQVLLRTLIRPDQKDWVERLPDVELPYNSSIHPTIEMSPFEFEHGSPVTSQLDTIIPREGKSDDHLLFLRRMQKLFVKARDQMAKT